MNFFVEKPGRCGAASERPLEGDVRRGLVAAGLDPSTAFTSAGSVNFAQDDTWPRLESGGQLLKASVATGRLRTGMIEPNSWDFSPTLPLLQNT